jgi:hypothetical protein
MVSGIVGPTHWQRTSRLKLRQCVQIRRGTAFERRSTQRTSLQNATARAVEGSLGGFCVRTVLSMTTFAVPRLVAKEESRQPEREDTHMRKREELVTRMLAERLGEIADIFREISDDLTAMSDTDAESDKTWVSDLTAVMGAKEEWSLSSLYLKMKERWSAADRSWPVNGEAVIRNTLQIHCPTCACYDGGPKVFMHIDRGVWALSAASAAN